MTRYLITIEESHDAIDVRRRSHSLMLMTALDDAERDKKIRQILEGWRAGGTVVCNLPFIVSDGVVEVRIDTVEEIPEDHYQVMAYYLPKVEG